MAISDKFKKGESLFSTTLSSGISTGTGETITLASVSGLPTDTEITLTFDRVDADGNATPSSMERITGTISGSNLTSYTRGTDDSTEQAHSASAVVEYIFNSQDWNDLIDGILVAHSQTGHHTITIADGTNTTGITVTQNDVTNNPNAVTITNAGTGKGIFIDQNGNGTGLYIDNAGTSQSLQIVQSGVIPNNNNSGAIYVLDTCSTATRGPLLNLRSDVAHTGSYFAYILVNNASSTVPALQVANAGTGNGLFINQDGNGIALNIGSEATTAHCVHIDSGATTGSVFYAVADALTTGSGFRITSDSANFAAAGAADAKGLLTVIVDHASATGDAAYIRNDGTGIALMIDQNGTPAASAIRFDGCTGTSTKSPETDAEAGFIKINIDGTDRYVPFYAAS